MTTPTANEKLLVKIAGFLGLIQGFAWIIMALICIVEYNKDPKELVVDENTTYTEIYNYLLYSVFLSHSPDIPKDTPDFIVTPKAFTIFMWFYVVECLLWIVVSILAVNSTKGKTTMTASIMKSWSFVTCAVCVIDLVLTILLGMDYDTCISSVPIFDFSCTAVFAAVMAISARGFTLWFINLIFAVVIFKIANKPKNYQDKILRADSQLPRVGSGPESPQQQLYGTPEGPNAQNVRPSYQTPYPAMQKPQYPPQANPSYPRNVESNPNTNMYWNSPSAHEAYGGNNRNLPSNYNYPAPHQASNYRY